MYKDSIQDKFESQFLSFKFQKSHITLRTKKSFLHQKEIDVSIQTYSFTSSAVFHSYKSNPPKMCFEIWGGGVAP